MKLQNFPWIKSLGLLTASLLFASASSAQEVSSGQSQDLDSHQSPYAYSLPPGKTTADIRGIGVAGSSDHVYVWYDDYTVSSGTSWDLDSYQSPQPLSLYPGYNGSMLRAVAIASNDHAYYYWSNGTVSQGTSTSPMTYAMPQWVNYPPGRSSKDLRGVAIAKSNNHVYAWFSDGKVSQGTSTDLDFYAAPQDYSLGGSYGPQDLAGVGISSNNRVYAWYHAEAIGQGFLTLEDEIETLVSDYLDDTKVAGVTVAASKHGKMVYDKGFGVADISTGERMEPFHRSRIGSVSKIVTSLAMMKYAENLDPAGLSVLDEPLYGFSGLLPSFQYLSDQTQGRRRHSPIVGTVIRKSDNHVFTFYDNGTVSSGNSSDLDSYWAGQAYSVTPNKGPEDIRAMAVDSYDNLYVWYADGSLSAGTYFDLDSGFYFDASLEGVSAIGLADGQSFNYLVGVGIAASNNRVYAWYEDGTKSSGNVLDLAYYSQGDTYSVPAGKTPYDIRSMAIANNDRVYTFYGDDTVSSGTSWDTDYHSGPYATSLAAGIVAKPWSTWYAAMTPRHLMTHTAGFLGGGDTDGAARMWNVTEDNLTYQQAHRYMLRTRPLLFAPGTSSAYSNHGLGLTGFLLQELTGVSYATYAEDSVLAPLGLDFGRNSDPLSAIDSHSHEVKNGKLISYTDDASPLGTAAGGWMTSAGDLVRLMLATDQDPGHPDILLGTTLDVMESAPFPSSPSRAHGWQKSGQGKLAHSGSVGGGRALIVKFPAGYTSSNGTDLSEVFVAVAVNTNEDGGDINDLVNQIALIVGSSWVSGGYDIY